MSGQLAQKLPETPRSVFAINSNVSNLGARAFNPLYVVVSLLGLAAVLHALFRNAWVTEDAYITFRSVEQLFAGNGPRWNPHERVQSFTHPLWFLLLATARLFTAHLYMAAIVLGLTCSVLTVLLHAISRPHAPARILFVCAAMMCSKAWVDFATSGLENSLSSLLITAFFLAAGETAAEVFHARTALLCYVLAALALTTRHDNLLVLLPVLAWIGVRSLGSQGVIRSVGLVALGFLPFLAWSGYSLLYFGFPFPNTAYAKLNLGARFSILAEKGWYYLLDSFTRDPVTLGVVLLACIGAIKNRKPFWLIAALGLLLHCAYLFKIGGDFMSGRFFVVPFAAAVVIAVRTLTPRALLVATLFILCSFFQPSHPFRRGVSQPIYHHGIADEKAVYWRTNSLRVCRRRWQRGLECPDSTFMRKGRQFASKKRPVITRGTIGMFGYAAGTDKIILDYVGLTDPLLARVPPRHSKMRTGHYIRSIPVGYRESVQSGQNEILHSGLAQYYEKLRQVVSEPIFSSERLKTVLLMNLGYYDGLLRSYAAHVKDRKQGQRRERGVSVVKNRKRSRTRSTRRVPKQP